MSSEAALLQEIQKLSGAIDRHKLQESKPPYAPRFHQSRTAYVNSGVNKKYVNPAIANKKYVNPAITNQFPTSNAGSSVQQQTVLGATRELVIGGVAFESSNRKLIRKDLISSKPKSTGSSNATGSTLTARPRTTHIRKGGKLVPLNRIHKPRFSKGKRLGGRNNMVLDNVKGTRTGNMGKRRKLDKQCRFFTMTGVCQRGLTCPYQHDPEKIAICSLFLSHSCPNTSDTCQLSHDPNPSRVPLCHHFANYGRCTRDDCPYPHVRVGPRHGVCRDFAVVGYCDKGIDCDKQHVRECPDFAENGSCPNKTCKLPHVIRANRKRQPTASTPQLQAQPPRYISACLQRPSRRVKEEYTSSPSSVLPAAVSPAAPTGLEPAEEYISLTFEESDEDEDEDDEDEENEEDEEEEMENQDADGTMEEMETDDVSI